MGGSRGTELKWEGEMLLKEPRSAMHRARAAQDQLNSNQRWFISFDAAVVTAAKMKVYL